MIPIECCSAPLRPVGVIHWQKHQWRRLRVPLADPSPKRPASEAKIGWVQPVQQQPDTNNTTFVVFFDPQRVLKESVSPSLVGDSFTTRQPPGNSRCPCIKRVTMVIYYQSRRGVSEYCGHRHNGAAVTGRSTQLARHKVGRMRLSRMQQLAALGIK